MNDKQKWIPFIIKIIIPTFLTIVLFIISIFSIIIPSFEKNMIDRKREMIRELVNSAYSTIEKYEENEKKGNIPRFTAQKKAASSIESMRYGNENKDYFWITDMHPRMIMHPYRPDLNGKDLSDFKDPKGKKLFVEFVEIAMSNEKGYSDYMWQWKDDPNRIVPKLSYVRLFKPWGWIIGTGIYIEDVKEEIAKITSDLIKVSLLISAIIALILVYITRQSFVIENRRREAEDEVLESREKYKSLIEVATEGFIMILDGRIVYGNNVILRMLDYSESDLLNLSLNKIFFNVHDTDFNKIPDINSLFSDSLEKYLYQAQIKTKDGNTLDVVVTVSNISFFEKKGFILIIKDISGDKKIELELRDSKERYKLLTNNLNIGVFRITFENKSRFVEVNPATLQIFGYSTREELFNKNITEIFINSEERNAFFNNLKTRGYVKNATLDFRKKDGASRVLSVSAISVKDENDNDTFCDAIAEDITEDKKLQEERENLIVELQSSLLFLNQPLSNYIKDIKPINKNSSIRETAEFMTESSNDAVFISTEEGNISGIVTDHDIRKSVVGGNLSTDSPVSEIMTSPVVSISERALIFEAILLMQEKNIKQVAVKNSSDKITGFVSNENLFKIQKHSFSFFIQEINEAQSVDEVVAVNEKLPRLIKSLVESGANSKYVTRIISTVSDSIVIKFINFAIKEIGNPPARFVFMALGSEGREEQTLATDQDNAIIYEDVADDKKSDVEKYFLQLGEKVCYWLDRAGNHYCKGEMMANNPKWNQAASKWNDYFSNWIRNGDPQDLFEVNVFFDFRPVYGDFQLTDNLKQHVHKVSEGRAPFFHHMAQTTLLYKPPISVFGNIQVESKGEHPESFNIKDSIKPIQNFARIYALKNKLDATNTLDRLNQLFERNIISKTLHEEIIQSYNYLMLFRFKNQVMSLNTNLPPDNYINPQNLTDIEHMMLKKIFSQITGFQSRLSYDFTGTAIAH